MTLTTSPRHTLVPLAIAVLLLAGYLAGPLAAQEAQLPPPQPPPPAAPALEKPPTTVELLAGRDWKPLTVVDPLVDKERQKEILGLLETAEREHDLRFIVITAKAQDIRLYAQVALALMQEKLMLDYGGVLVCTEDPRSQIIAYTTLLETRLGERQLRNLDMQALAVSSAAMGNSERAVSMVRTVLEGLGKAMGPGPNRAEAALTFGPTPRAETNAPADAAEVAALAERSAPAETPAPPVETPAQPVAAVTPAAERESAAPMGLIAFLAVLVAGAIGFVAARNMSGRERMKKPAPLPSPLTAASPIRTAAPENEDTPLDDVADTVGAPKLQPILKPRQVEARGSRKRTGNSSPDLPDVTLDCIQNLSALAEANRRKSAVDHFDAAAELDSMTLQEIQMHYRALFKIVPPASRPALTESLDRLLEAFPAPPKF